jgi:hypothetical protein
MSRRLTQKLNREVHFFNNTLSFSIRCPERFSARHFRAHEPHHAAAIFGTFPASKPVKNHISEPLFQSQFFFFYATPPPRKR